MTTAFTGTIEQALAYANSRPVVLAELVAGVFLYHWTQDGTYTNCWWTPVAPRVVAVRSNGVPFAAVGSLATLNSFSPGYFYDAAAQRLYINKGGTPYDGSTMQALVAFNWSDHARDQGGVPYVPRLASTPALDLSIPARFTSQEDGRGGSLVVEQAEGTTPTDPGAFDALADLDWDAGYVTIKFGADPVY